MTKLQVGDRVRVKPSYNGSKNYVGMEGVLHSVSYNTGCFCTEVATLGWAKGVALGFPLKDLELVSSKADKNLADEYRTLIDAAWEIRRQLEDKGFVLTLDGRPQAPWRDRNYSRQFVRTTTVTKTETL